MRALYNEIDPFAAQWLRNLVDAGHVAAGRVEERSIRDLRAEDVQDATQAHFFAGIGVWSYALKLAGWPDEVPVWTGSCPCQPFSAAGKRAGTADPRHLWPEWFRLIRECRPSVVFGEQVASAGDWLDLVSSDMEGEGYAFGAAVLGSHSVGAPHIRQRLYFVAYAQGAGSARRDGCSSNPDDGRRRTERQGAAGLVAYADGERLDGIDPLLLRGRPQQDHAEVARSGEAGELGNPGSAGLAERERHGRVQPEAVGTHERQAAERGSNPLCGFWSDAEWIPCRDGKSRPVKPGTFPLVAGYPNRVGILRAAGNALNAQQAACFIRAAVGSLLDLGRPAALLAVLAGGLALGLAGRAAPPPAQRCEVVRHGALGGQI